MATLQDRLRSAAAQNSILLESLSEVASAPPALKRETARIQSLTAQISTSEKELYQLRVATKLELAQHAKYRDSKIRKHFKKDKFAEEAAKEEREYHDALMKQTSAEDALATLRSDLDYATKAKAELEGPAQLHMHLQAQLDQLYAAVFADPTPTLPAQDELKAAFVAADAYASQLRRALDSERQVLELLRQARSHMRQASASMATAHSAATWDLVGGGSIAAIAKHNAADAAKMSVWQAQTAITEAKRIQTQVQQIPGFDGVPLNVWTELVFDNIFTDYSVYQQIKKAEEQVGRASRKLDQEIERTHARLKEMSGDLEEAMGRVEAARAELQLVRSTAFESVLGKN